MAKSILLSKTNVVTNKSNNFKYFSEIIDIFEGLNREWCLRKPFSKIFCTPFFIENANNIQEQALAFEVNFDDLKSFEATFTIQKFSDRECKNMFDWDLIIDIDDCELSKRKEPCVKILNLLHDFKLDSYMCIDSRMHIWFPQWLKNNIPNWCSYYNNEFAEAFKYFFWVLCRLKYIATIDSGMLYWHRHKIRVPFTYHPEDNQLQLFYDNTFNKLHVKEFINLWKGSEIPLLEIDKICNTFKQFIEYVYEEGKILKDCIDFKKVKIEDKKTYALKSGGLRFCFESATNNIFADSNINHMTHKMRLALVQEAISSGYGYNEETHTYDVLRIVKLFEKQNDFNLKQSMYQVTKLLQNITTVKPWRCSTIQEQGWCLREKCKNYGKRT